MSLFSRLCRACELTRLCTVSVGMLLLIIWGIWGWAMLTYWYLDDAPVAEFGQGTISDPVVKPYQSVVVRVPIQKFRVCPGQATRYITGECGHHILSTAQTVMDKGFVGDLVYPFTIPDSVAAGKCAFRTQTVYRCNLFDGWLERQVYTSPSIPFEVQR